MRQGHGHGTAATAAAAAAHLRVVRIESDVANNGDHPDVVAISQPRFCQPVSRDLPVESEMQHQPLPDTAMMNMVAPSVTSEREGLAGNDQDQDRTTSEAILGGWSAHSNGSSLGMGIGLDVEFDDEISVGSQHGTDAVVGTDTGTRDDNVVKVDADTVTSNEKVATEESSHGQSQKRVQTNTRIQVGAAGTSISTADDGDGSAISSAASALGSESKNVTLDADGAPMSKQLTATELEALSQARTLMQYDNVHVVR
jgi:hypothetical protein